MTEGLIGGAALQLVTVYLSDDDAGEISDERGKPLAPAPPVVSHLAPVAGARAGVLSVGARGTGRPPVASDAMSERSKLTSSHLRRQAFVYLRQSSQTQLERNVESTARQYALVTRAIELGFTREQVVVIDEDLGISGSGLSERSGFARLTAEVALGHAGLVLGLEVSRLARNNADWYRLLDLCGVTDTVIGDADGIYHPGSFNDRLLLGLKGTMSRGGVARAARPAGGRDPQQGRARRAAQGAAGRLGVGRGRRRDPARSRRSDPRRDPDDLRPVRRAGVGPPGLAVDAPRAAQVPDAPLRARRASVGSPDLPPDPQRARQPRLRRRVRVREDPPRALRRRAREHAPADASPPPSRMGRVDLGSPPRLHRQGHVRGQPRADRRRTPARAHTRPAARSAKAARCCRGSPSADAADASSTSPTTAAAAMRARSTSAPAGSWSRTAAAGACASAGCRSTRPSPARCSPRSPPPA